MVVSAAAVVEAAAEVGVGQVKKGFPVQTEWKSMAP